MSTWQLLFFINMIKIFNYLILSRVLNKHLTYGKHLIIISSLIIVNTIDNGKVNITQINKYIYI